jgi:hypothetical protein
MHNVSGVALHGYHICFALNAYLMIQLFSAITLSDAFNLTQIILKVSLNNIYVNYDALAKI